jgi:hypothetical protein
LALRVLRNIFDAHAAKAAEAARATVSDVERQARP